MTTPISEDEIIVRWDTFDTYESYEEYVKRTKEDYTEEYLGENPYFLSEEAWIDDQTDASYAHYQDMLAEVQTAMQVFATDYWHVEGKNLGWRHRSGYRTFRAEKAEDFLHAILPNNSIDDNIFTLSWQRDEQGVIVGMNMVNSHHDAMGEQYTIRAATEEEQEDI